jgi:Fe-S oxidoreductase
VSCAPPRAERAAVVGAGPAGLIAAHDLRRAGLAVTLIEGRDRIGGCLTYRIPEWRLPAAVRERDLTIIDALRIEVRTGVLLGRDVDLAELRSEHEIVVLAPGFAGGQELLADSRFDLATSARDTIGVDPTSCATGMDRLFAAGDAVSGPTSVIDAMALGRRAAEAALRSLDGDCAVQPGPPGPPRLLWSLEIDESVRRRRQRTPLLMQAASPQMTEKEVRREGERCLDCSCDRCVQDCEFLAKHCSSPRELARKLSNGIDEHLEPIYSCNVCGLCATLCPVDLDTGAMMLAARREAVRSGIGPLPVHRNVRRELRAGVSATFTLAASAPGRRRARRLFFTGCELPATAPGHTRALYDHLLRQDPRIGVLMYCCGVPAEILGLEDEGARARHQIVRAMEDLGADELIVACPQCHETLGEHLTEIRVSSVWELLAETWDPSRRFEDLGFAIHDPCRGRHEPEVHAAIRTLIRTCGAEVVETEYSHERTRCCGFGGKIETVDPELFVRIAGRAAAESTLPMLTYCTGCRAALHDTGRETIHVLDLLMSGDPMSRASKEAPGVAVRLGNRLRAKWAIRRMAPPVVD